VTTGVGVGESIARVEALSPDQFQEQFASKGWPVIVTGHHQEARARWSLDYLVLKHPQHEVQVDLYPDGDRNKEWSQQAMPLAEYVAKIRNPENRRIYYLAEQRLNVVLPNVAGEVSAPPFVREHERRHPFGFIGIDTFSSAHYHPAPVEAALMQMVGRKRIALCPARGFRSLHPNAWWQRRYNWAQVRFNQESGQVRPSARGPSPAWVLDEELERYPSARKAPLIECVVEAGEVLFIPQGWFHLAYGLGESISVTYFFKGKWRNAHLPIAVRDTLAKSWVKAKTRLARLGQPRER
jgi:hypothetical protein